MNQNVGKKSTRKCTRGTCFFGSCVRRKQLDCDLGQHPLHPQADLSAGSTNAAYLLFQRHSISKRTIVSSRHRVALRGQIRAHSSIGISNVATKLPEKNKMWCTFESMSIQKITERNTCDQEVKIRVRDRHSQSSVSQMYTHEAAIKMQL